MMVSTTFSVLHASAGLFLGLTFCSLYLYIHTLRDAYGDFEYGAFVYHPALMCFAFVFCMPVASTMYVWENLLGMSHQMAKVVHFIGQTCAMVLSIVGVKSMWKTHSTSTHFQSLHSWIGIGVVALFGIQWLHGCVCFLIKPAILEVKSRKTKMVFLHAFMGMGLNISALATVLLGSLSLVWRGEKDGVSNTMTWRRINGAAVCLYMMSMFLMLTLTLRRTYFNNKSLVQNGQDQIVEAGAGNGADVPLISEE